MGQSNLGDLQNAESLLNLIQTPPLAVQESQVFNVWQSTELFKTPVLLPYDEQGA